MIFLGYNQSYSCNYNLEQKTDDVVLQQQQGQYTTDPSLGPRFSQLQCGSQILQAICTGSGTETIHHLASFPTDQEHWELLGTLGDSRDTGKSESRAARLYKTGRYLTLGTFNSADTYLGILI